MSDHSKKKEDLPEEKVLTKLGHTNMDVDTKDIVMILKDKGSIHVHYPLYLKKSIDISVVDITNFNVVRTLGLIKVLTDLHLGKQVISSIVEELREMAAKKWYQ